MKILVKVSGRNEKENMPGILKRLQTLQERNTFDIIAIDDGSQDNSQEMIQRMGIPLIRFDESRGVSAGHREGLRYALNHGYDVFITLDGDGQHEPEHVPQIIKALCEGVGFVQCTRYHNEKEYNRAPLDRRLLCDGVLGMLRRHVGWEPLSDALCGFWGMRREVFEPLLPSLKVEGYGFQIELLLRLWRMTPRPDRMEIPHPAIYKNGTNRIDLLYVEKRLEERMGRFTIHAHHVYEVLRDLDVPP